MAAVPPTPASLSPDRAARSEGPAGEDDPSDAPVATVPPDVRPVLKQVGRGNVGSRSLSARAMQILFGEVLDERVPDLELGGLLIAFRMKGESVDEIAGALAALQARLSPVPIDPQKPVIAIPSYNGARHSANLTPLLAGLLADAGLQVIIHGVRDDPSRVTTCEILKAMGHAPAASVAEAGISLERGNPAFVPIDVLCPPFARLLNLRERLGVRHIGHTLAKLIAPVDSARYGAEHCIRLMSFTHPEFNKLQLALMERLGARAVVMRGSEGEAVAGVKRMVQMDWIEGGRTHTISAAELRPMGRPLMLPPAQDAVATAGFIQAALAGEQPVPENVARQVALIVAAIQEGAPPPAQASERAAAPAAPGHPDAASDARHPEMMARARPQANPQ